MGIRDLFNLGTPHAPEVAKNWGEAVSDNLDLTTLAEAMTLGDADLVRVVDGVGPKKLTGANLKAAVSGGIGTSSIRNHDATFNDPPLYDTPPPEGYVDLWDNLGESA